MVMDSALLRKKELHKETEELQKRVAVKPKKQVQQPASGEERDIRKQITERTREYKENPRLAEVFLKFVKEFKLEEGVGPSKVLGMSVPVKTEEKLTRAVIKRVEQAYRLLEPDAYPPLSTMNKVAGLVKSLMTKG